MPHFPKRTAAGGLNYQKTVVACLTSKKDEVIVYQIADKQITPIDTYKFKSQSIKHIQWFDAGKAGPLFAPDENNIESYQTQTLFCCD